ncbi:hypothetical protein pb186bvf_007766 [Paramecium bursaria]
MDLQALSESMINDWLEHDEHEEMENLNNAQIFSNPPSEQKQRRKLIIEDSPVSSNRKTVFEGCYFNSQNKQEKIQFTAIKMMQDKVTQSDCPICIAELKNQTNILQFEPCGHMGCESCMRKWIEDYKAQCPLCRCQCQDIYIIRNGDIRQKEKIFIQYAQEKGPEFYLDDEEDDTGCMVCGQDTTTNLLLVCDRCDRNYCHTFCDPALYGSIQIPDTLWYCLDCRRHRLIYNQIIIVLFYILFLILKYLLFLKRITLLLIRQNFIIYKNKLKNTNIIGIQKQILIQKQMYQKLLTY